MKWFTFPCWVTLAPLGRFNWRNRKPQSFLYSSAPENHAPGSLDLNYFPDESSDSEAMLSASGRRQDQYFHAALSLQLTPAAPEKELGFPTCHSGRSCLDQRSGTGWLFSVVQYLTDVVYLFLLGSPFILFPSKYRHSSPLSQTTDQDTSADNGFLFKICNVFIWNTLMCFLDLNDLDTRPHFVSYLTRQI